MKPAIHLVRAAAALAALLLATACAPKAPPPAAAGKAVVTVVAALRDLSGTQAYAGRLAPATEVTILPKVAGRLATVRATVGGRVAAGEVLATLESQDYDAQYRQAQAALRSADASLTRTNDAGLGQQVIQAQASLDAAQVAYDEAASLYERTKRLADAGAVARQQLDDVEARMKAAGIQRDSAAQNLALVKDKAGPQASDVASGQVGQAQAQADLARNQLDATILRSPLSGSVSYRNAEIGELVGPGTPLFVVIDDRSVYAEAGVSEAALPRLLVGMEVRVTVDALGPEGQLTGRLESLSPSADPRTLLYLARVRLPNPQGRLRPGMLARILAPAPGPGKVLALPERAVFSREGRDLVYRVVEGRVEVAEVELGRSDGAYVEVRKGLSTGESVILEGQEFVAEGDRVAVSPAP